MHKNEAFTGYIPTFDGWRCLAISLVVFSHVAGALGNEGAPILIGQKGVDLFFGLSGLLITSRLLQDNSEGWMPTLRRFYIRRFFRIVPAAALYLITISILALAGVVVLSIKDVVSSAFFFRNYIHGNTVTGHFWSLSVEEHFYLLWPSLLVFLRRKISVYVGAGIMAAVAVWRAIHLPSAASIPNFWSRTDFRLDAILAGCVLALLLHNQALQSFFRRHGAFVFWGCGAAYLLTTGGHLHWASLFTSVQAALIPIALACTALNPHLWPSRLLELRGLRWIGRISYSIYLWNLLLIDPTSRSSPAIAAIRVAMAFLIGAASYYLVERPLIRIGQRLAGAKTEDFRGAAAAAR